MNRTLVLAFALSVGILHAVVPTINTETVSLVQDENTRIVTVNYDLENAPGIVTVDFLTNGVSIGAENFQNVWGDVNRRLEAGSGKKLFWPAGNDWPGHLLEDGTLSVALTAWATNAPPPFVAIDVAVSTAVPVIPFFYACEAAVPGGVTNNLYKTERILLKRVFAAGVRWRMGSLSWETGRENREVAHDVVLTNDYYLGIYPVTQRQYFLAANSLVINSAHGDPVNTGKQNVFKGRLDSDMRPAENMAWSDLRGDGNSNTTGYNWPKDGHAVNPSYFLGKLRASTGLAFDLPSEAQWEYACRAGCADIYYIENATLDDLAWYSGNSTVDGEMQTHPVGQKPPNAWGFYDMLGNVQEWCLDWYANAYAVNADGSPVLEPQGPEATSGNRIRRGGAFSGEATKCRCAMAFYNWSQAAQNAIIGFRLCCPVGVR